MVLTGSVWPKFRYIYEPSCSELYTLCTPNPTPPPPFKKKKQFYHCCIEQIYACKMSDLNSIAS